MTYQESPGEKEWREKYAMVQEMVRKLKDRIDMDCKALERRVRKLDLGKALDELDGGVGELNYWLDTQAWAMFEAGRRMAKKGEMVSREEMAKERERQLRERKGQTGELTDSSRRLNVFQKAGRAFGRKLRKVSDLLEHC